MLNYMSGYGELDGWYWDDKKITDPELLRALEVYTTHARGCPWRPRGKGKSVCPGNSSSTNDRWA